MFWRLFLQVFDRGVMEDGEGREVDFRNTILILTSNTGAEAIQRLADRNGVPELDDLLAAVRPDLSKAIPGGIVGTAGGGALHAHSRPGATRHYQRQAA